VNLTAAQRDRAVGAILGAAVGDALGAGYEFGPPLADEVNVGMIGGGRFDWEPGEWTDDTSMAVPILETVALEPLTESALDGIVGAWLGWAREAADVGIQTRRVLTTIDAPTAAAARVAAKTVHDATGRSAGNGSLMRTAPVVLGYLDDPVGLATAAREVSALTHYEADAGDACALWCLAIWHAIHTGSYDVHAGIAAVDDTRRWEGLLDDAGLRHPRDFADNGWVVEALQGAWSAIADSTSYRDAVERAVRGGRDTDTVAAIAGALAGARWGASNIPTEWLEVLHGWPGLRADGLRELAERALDRVTSPG
jgi:ADP-ribosyl-[dinitrogen reductase] hydrolase